MPDLPLTRRQSELGGLDPCLVAALAIVFLVAIALLAATDHFFCANLLLAASIGLLTGSTELLARFRDRPFDVLTSIPGLTYVVVNGVAGGLAFYLLDRLVTPPLDPVREVFIAGFSAMAVFRTGLFTARVGKQDIAFGPSIVLKVLLDTLDRSYDRIRAAKRAELIKEYMGGIDFDSAKISLTELCVQMMQNVSGDERDSLMISIDRIASMTGISGDARSMVFGMAMMNIVGEDALRAATVNLGSTIFAPRPLAEQTARELARRDPQRIIDDLLPLANQLGPDRARLNRAQIQAVTDSIPPLQTADSAITARLIAIEVCRQYGDNVLAEAISLLPIVKDTVPEFIPAAPA